MADADGRRFLEFLRSSGGASDPLVKALIGATDPTVVADLAFGDDGDAKRKWLRAEMRRRPSAVVAFDRLAGAVDEACGGGEPPETAGPRSLDYEIRLAVH